MTAEPNAQPRPNSWRLRVYPAALIGTLLATLLLAAVVYDRDDPETRLGGDYPAFYAAGSIALEGDWDELYLADRQRTEQAGLIDDQGGFLYFSYPPFVAAAYAPLSGVDYRWSFLIHTVLMALALHGAVKLLWPFLKDAGWPPVALFTLALAFYPLLRSVPGGQNTTLSLLLLALVVRLDHEERPMLAGLAMAMLLFKPQFGVVMVPLLVVGRRWRMLGGWVAGAGLLYVTSVLLMGGSWVADWWEQASSFRDVNVTANGVNFVSYPGFVENLAGVGSPLVWVVGYGLGGAVGLVVAYFWWKYPRSHALPRFALAAAAVVVAAPQTLYYDAGLLLLGLVAVFPFVTRQIRWIISGVLIISWAQLAAPSLGWSPLGPIAWTAVALLLWKMVVGEEALEVPGTRKTRG
ncbi:MAG: glycosyltransferase family 87 protein [Actinomycetota bacterium]|nr:glycosyltransferase family 87 protein [Actinomycetota bacterium]